MVDDIARFAHIGYLVTQELVRRHQSGRSASTRSLERTLLSLVGGPSAHISFRRFITEAEDDSDEEN